MARAGESVPHLWAPMSRPEPVAAPSNSRAQDDTRTSDAGPAWMTATNSLPPSVIPPWDWITSNRYAHRRHAVMDDTANSFDAPDWFHPGLKARGAPSLTRRAASFPLGGTGRVVLKPLVEIDAHGLGMRPHELESPAPRPGYVPDEGERAAMDATHRPRDGRWGVTTSTVIGAPMTAEHEFRAPRPRGLDRRGLTSAADLDLPGGPINDPFGGSSVAGEAGRRRERARSVAARMGHSLRGAMEEEFGSLGSSALLGGGGGSGFGFGFGAGTERRPHTAAAAVPAGEGMGMGATATATATAMATGAAASAGAAVGFGAGGETSGGAAPGLPALTLPGGAGRSFAAEPPSAGYYAWKRASMPEEVVFGAPGLARGAPAAARAARTLQNGGRAGHAEYQERVNAYGARPGQHLLPAREALQARAAATVLGSTGRTMADTRAPRLRDAPFAWYGAKR